MFAERLRWPSYLFVFSFGWPNNTRIELLAGHIWLFNLAIVIGLVLFIELSFSVYFPYSIATVGLMQSIKTYKYPFNKT